MSLWLSFLLAAIASLVCGQPGAPLTDQTKAQTVNLPHASGAGPSAIYLRRQLRATRADDNDNDSIQAEEASDTEERVIPGLASLSNTASKVSTTVKKEASSTIKWVNVYRWADAGKSKAYVQKKLGMEGLTGDLLKAHKNYKYFEKFVAKDESYRLNDWLKQELPTYNVWVILGLDDIPALTVKQTEEFQTYSKYVKLFDDDVLRWKNTPYRVPTTIARDASTVEMMAKTEIWAKSKQSPEFVKKMLGLDKLSGAALLKHDDYKYYQDFLMLSNRREA